jgi:O-antigen/teichoic acid export membrane protein
MFDRMVTFFGCIAVGIVACMPFVFNIMVNEQFSEAYNLVPLYMIAVFFNAIIGMISAIYLIENETKRVAISTMVAAAINLLVDIALVRFIGSYAAPISSICGYATISFWRLYDVNKRHCKIGMSFRKVIALLLALFITMVSYYSSYKIIQIVVLVVVAVGSCLLNKEFLNEFFMLLVSKIKK